MHSKRIIFAGTPDFAAPCLTALLEKNLNVVGVYTQPDRAAGRGKKPQQSPVKKRALQAEIAVFQPESFKPDAAHQTLAALKPDLMVVVAYGLILPQAVLDIPTLGCVNIHASLLPRWRGAAPIQRAIEAGDKQTGVCLMQMNKGLDTGPVLACREYTIKTNETGGMLHDALSSLGAQLLQDKINEVLENTISPMAQASGGVSYAHKLSKAESDIDWQSSAHTLANKIRAFTPWPVMTTRLDQQTIRIHHAMPLANHSSTPPVPGTIIDASKNGIEVHTSDGVLNIIELQKPGGKKMHARDFLNGFILKPGQRFE